MPVFFDPYLWPLLAGFAFLITAAVFQWLERVVPNLLCLAFVVAALAVATAISLDVAELGRGGIGSSLLGLSIGLGTLIPFYARGVLGAGCVKAQATFGAWVGCALPAADCWKVVAAATFVAAIVTATTGYVSYRLRFEEESQPYLFPAQITLSVGSIVGVIGFLIAAL